MLASTYQYPLLNLFWTMLVFTIFVFWIILVFQIMIDIFRSHDIGGGVKALWIFFIIFLPFLGVFVYVLARGKGMAERRMAEAAAQQAAFEDYVREVANKKQ